MSQSIQLQVTQVGLEQSIAAAMRRAGNSAQINLGTNSRQINALSQPLGRITGQADEFSKSMAAANARVLAFGASAGIIAGVSAAMGGLLASTIKVEKSLVEIGSVLNTTGAELDRFGQGIFNVAKNTGKSFQEVADGALELARQGLDTEDALARLNDALILSRLSGLDAKQSVEGLTAAFNSFKSTGITTAEILNKVVAVSQEFAVSERDIIEGLGRSASVADLAGVSFEELAAIITAVQEKTARGGAVIGNSFKTIFARIQDKAVLSDLEAIGIGVTDLQGNVLPALKILENLAAQMDSFSQIEQADISKKLGGIYQLDKLLAALKDLSSTSSVYRKALEEQELAGTKAYQKNALLNTTLDALINKVAVSAEQLGAKLGEIGVTDSLKNVLGFFNSLLEGIQNILGEESGLGNMVRGLVKGLGNFLAGPGLAIFGAIILKLSKDLVQFGFASLKAFFGIGKAAKEVQNVESAISQILAKNVNLQQQLFALEGNRAAQLRVITTALVEQEALLRRSAAISSGLAAPLYGAGVRAGGSGLRVGNSAGGYMPAVAKESAAIKQGVGGARSGDKPVVIPNFSFGGGKKGTMIAHTGEYIIPNFNGSGGSAVFNRQMVQSMGLPSGAKKIGAAGGFVPNFAGRRSLSGESAGTGAANVLDELDFSKLQNISQVKDAISNSFRVTKTGKKALTVDYQGKKIRISDAVIETKLGSKLQQQQELFYNSNNKPGALMLIPETRAFNATALNTKFANKENRGGIDGFIGGVAGIDPSPDNQKFAKLTNIDKEIAEALSTSAVNILKDFDESIKIKPESALSPDSILKSVLQEGGAGAYGAFKGALFESVIKLVSKTKGQEGGTLDVDFNQGREALETIFGIQGKGYRYADVKNSTGQKDKFISQVMANLPVKTYPNKIQKGAISAAGGFLPNFANPLQDAIEREIAAGVPTSQIYVDKNSSLKNAMNPMGLMVANRRDEPAGGFQGINRARREGVNPMMYGAARGFIPNYAVEDNSGGTNKVLASLFIFQTAVSVASGFLDQAGDSGKKLSEALQKLATTALIFGGIAFSGPVKRLKQFSDEVFEITRTVKNSKVGLRGGFSQGFRSGVAGKGSEFFTPKGIDPALADRYNRRLSNRYNLSGVGLGAGRVGAVAGGLTRGAGALLGSVAGPATLAIGAFKGLSEVASAFRTYSNAAAKSLGEISIYAGKASQSLSELDKAAIEAETKRNYGASFDTITGAIADVVGASAFASAVTGQQVSNTNYRGRNVQLSNVSEEQFKAIEQAFISSYVGANRTKFGKAEDAAGVASREFGSMFFTNTFDEYTAENLKSTIKELSEEAQKMQKDNAIAEAMKQASIETEIAERDLINFDNILGNSAQKIIDLRKNIFNLQSSTDIFKSISEATIDNAYNLSEYDKTIQKLGASLGSLDASSAIKQLDLISKTQENIVNLTKESLKGQTVQESGLASVFSEIQNTILSGGRVDTESYNAMDLNRLFGDDYKKVLADISKEFNSQTTELKNQATEAQNNINIETYRSLLAQKTTSALESQTKQLDLQKSSAEKIFEYTEKIRNSTDKISDLNFEKGLIGATQRQRLSAQIGRRPELDRRTREASLSNFKQDRAGFVQSLESLIPSTLSAELQLSLKSGILNATKSIRDQSTLEDVSKTAVDAYNKTIKDINDAVQKESNERQGYIDKIQNALVGSSVTFESSVISAANKFKQITIEAANIPSVNRLKELEAQRSGIKTSLSSKTLTQEEKIKLDELKAAITKNKDTLVQELPENAALLKKDQEIAKAEEAVKKLDDAITELETKIKNFSPAPISNGVPFYLQPPDPAKLESSTTTPLPTVEKSTVDKGLEAAQKEQTAALLENANANANASDELEKLDSVARILADEFAQLKDGIPAAIASITSQRNKSISGAEILGANYDLATQEQLRGAQSEEEYNKIIRDRQNKGIGQLFAEEYGKTAEEQALDLKKTIVDASVQFKNNMIEGIMGAVEGSTSLKDGLRSAAYEFVKTINQKMMSNLIDKVVGGTVQSGTGQTSGGLVGLLSGMFGSGGMASGGKVNGGSGMKDDVPAMLMGGEYVVNKKAVSKYGSQFLESINNGTLTGYAKGGKVQAGPQGNFYTPGTFGQGAIEGKQNLLDFATQTGTSGQFDKIINELGYQSVALEAESSRLSVSGMRNTPMFEATQSAKEQAFDLYLQQYNQEIEARKQKEAQKKAMRNQLIMLAASVGLSAAATAGKEGFQAGFEGAKGEGFTKQLGAGAKGIFTGAKVNGQQLGGINQLFSSAGKAFSGNFSGAVNQFKLSQIGNAKQLSDLYQSDKKFASYIDSMGGLNMSNSSSSGISRGITAGQSGYGKGATVFGNIIPPLPSLSPQEIDTSLFPKNAIGGMIPSASGIDTVPAMLSGGEFVMNRSAVQGIGAPALQSMNSGGTSITSEETSKELNEKLLAKLDELINSSGSAGNITINVAPSGQTTQENSQDPSEKRQQLARQIKSAVLQIINDEKRIGGSLRR